MEIITSSLKILELKLNQNTMWAPKIGHVSSTKCPYPKVDGVPHFSTKNKSWIRELPHDEKQAYI